MTRDPGSHVGYMPQQGPLHSLHCISISSFKAPEALNCQAVLLEVNPFLYQTPSLPGLRDKSLLEGSSRGWENSSLSFSSSTPLVLNWNIRHRKEEKAALHFFLTPKPHSLPHNWFNSPNAFARACSCLHTIRLVRTHTHHRYRSVNKTR